MIRGKRKLMIDTQGQEIEIDGDTFDGEIAVTFSGTGENYSERRYLTPAQARDLARYCLELADLLQQPRENAQSVVKPAAPS